MHQDPFLLDTYDILELQLSIPLKAFFLNKRITNDDKLFVNPHLFAKLPFSSPSISEQKTDKLDVFKPQAIAFHHRFPLKFEKNCENKKQNLPK